jgi:prevent-host-death family protein
MAAPNVPPAVPPITPRTKRIANVVSALDARARLGQIMERATEKEERFIVDRRGKPSVIIMSVRDYLRNIAPTPAAYRAIRREAEKSGSSSLSARDIEHEIAAVRLQTGKKKSRPAG